MIAPISDFKNRRVNTTLHGRSVYRKQDIPGHNVFKGYSTPGTGDALDIYASSGTEVYAIEDCTQTLWQNDTTKKEVIYLTGDNWVAVYAHIDASYEGTNIKIKEGAVVGHVRGDLTDHHLHFELWINGKSISADTPSKLLVKMAQIFRLDNPKVVKINGQTIPYVLLNSEAIVKLRDMTDALGLVIDTSKYPVIIVNSKE
ncbi:MAG: Peptidase family M23 [Firmicutes bacterium ADurb.Bin419]|nr:MAG: Peptidase family M23 [Firmicutes bacterium ADurb.Bin419]